MRIYIIKSFCYHLKYTFNCNFEILAVFVYENMNLNITKISDNFASITPNDNNQELTNEQSKVNWLYNCRPLAEKIFSPNSTLIIVTKWHLKDVLSDDAKDFRQNLKDNNKRQYLKDIHHFMTFEFIHKDVKYIITSLYNVPKAVIDDLITSEEFIWGNMYLIRCENVLDKLSDDLMTDIKEVLNKSTFLEMPVIKCQLLATTDDGCKVLWFNPSHNIK